MDFVGFPLQSILSSFDDGQAKLGQEKRGDRVTLILDTKGCIQYCSEPAMFAEEELSLQGQPVTAVIPTLPYRSRTPGYNVAYTRFAFENDRWHRHSVKLSDGHLAPMDVMVRAIAISHGYCLLVLLKPQGEAVSEQVSVRKPQLRYVPSAESVRNRQLESSDTRYRPEIRSHGDPIPMRAANGW